MMAMTTTRILLSAFALSACASLPSPAEQTVSQPLAPVASLDKPAAPPLTGDQSVVVLYKGASTSAANRVDEDVAAAIRMVETRLNDRGIKDGLALKTVQPSADVQKLLTRVPRFWSPSAPKRGSASSSVRRAAKRFLLRRTRR